MVTKNKAREVQDEMKESAHRIWLAGLGAMAVAEEESGKLFKTLVEKGEDIEKRGRQRVEKAKGSAKGAVGGFRTVAESYWETMRRTVDDQITTVIHRLGVPTKEEITKLTTKVDELTRSVDKLRTQPTAPKTSTRTTSRKGAGSTGN